MASLNNVKKRIRATEEIGKITKAMEMVAAVKMRKVQEVLLKSRFYAFDALEVLGNIIEYLKSEEKFLDLVDNKSPKTLVVVITSDKGLIGSFNNTILKEVDVFLKKNGTQDILFLPIGEKAKIFLEKKNIPFLAFYTNYGDILDFEEIEEINKFLFDGYKKGEWGKILVFSMHFYSALKQKVVERQILPFDFRHLREVLKEIIPESGKYSELKKEIFSKRPLRYLDYIMEPNPEDLLKEILPHLFKIQVYHIILEANVSEHSCRRFTMKNAFDNSEEIKKDLLLQYNKLRQEFITKEINEITSTVAAMDSNT